MSELIKREDALECFMGFDRMGDVKDAIAALPAIDPADRIEALTKERDTAREYAGEVRIREKVADDARIEAEAKLAKAEEERDDLGRKLNTARYGQPDFAWSIHEEAMADLRAKLTKALDEREQALKSCEQTLDERDEALAKLTKAMEALREISSEALVPVHTWRNGINFRKMYMSWRALAVKRIDRARAVLAELEAKE